MQIQAPHLAHDGKASSASRVHAAEHSLSHADNGPRGSAQMFVAALDDAMQCQPACDDSGSSTTRSTTADGEQSAQPTDRLADQRPPAGRVQDERTVAEASNQEDEAEAAGAQLDASLQAFVSSLPATVTSNVLRPFSAVAASADAAEAASAAIDARDVTAPVAWPELAGAAQAFGIAGGRGKPSVHATRGADAAHAGVGVQELTGMHAALRGQAIAAHRSTDIHRAAASDGAVSGAWTGTWRDALPPEITNAHGRGAPELSLLPATAAGTPTAAVSSPTLPAQASAAAAAHIAPHLYAPAWREAVGQQVLWMAQREHQMASLTMNPPELGPVRVTLAIADGQASVSFVSLQPEVRQALQEAVPRLKEMLADAGLSLQQASVDSGDARDDGRSHSHEDTARPRAEAVAGRTFGARGAHADETTLQAQEGSLRTARDIAASRLVDLFA